MEVDRLLASGLDPVRLYRALLEVLRLNLGISLGMVAEVDAGGGLRRVTANDLPSALDGVPLLVLQLSLMWPSIRERLLRLEGAGIGADLTALSWKTGRNARIKSLRAFPMAGSDGLGAVLFLGAADPAFFRPPMIALLGRILDRVGVSLGPRRECQRPAVAELRQRRAVRLLGVMVKVVARNSDEQTLFADACHVICGVGGYRFAWVGTVGDESSGVLQTRAWHGDFPADEGGIKACLTLAESVLKDGQASAGVVSRSNGVERVVWSEQVSLFAVPLLQGSLVVGVLVVGVPALAPFEPAETEVLSELAGGLGLGFHLRRARAARLGEGAGPGAGPTRVQGTPPKPPPAVLILSRQGVVKFANETFCRMFRLDHAPDALRGLPFSVLYGLVRAPSKGLPFDWRGMREMFSSDTAWDRPLEALAGQASSGHFLPIYTDGEDGWLWCWRDLSAQEDSQLPMAHPADCDDVTGLPSRQLLMRMLDQALRRAASGESQLALGVLNLDGFKAINGRVGHGGGDQVLAEAGRRIQGVLRRMDVLARFSGNEFALLIPWVGSRRQVDVISRCVLQALSPPLNLKGEQLQLSASMGWTLAPQDSADVEGLVRHACMALQKAKSSGEGRTAFFEPAMEREHRLLEMMRDRFGRALLQRRLNLLYQPIVYADGLSGMHGVAGVEALLRLDDDDAAEAIAPSRFMHLLDDPQLARPIGCFVLEEAMRQCQLWLREGLPLQVSVNISTHHLLHPEFFADLDAALEHHTGVMDIGFAIEVTETGPILDKAQAKEVIAECRRRGIRVSLDDFGTGNASLSHMQQLDIAQVKLDQSFVRDIRNDERSRAIATGVITAARMMAKTVVAEGVEMVEQGDLLASLGCHQLQGFAISRPLPASAVPGWVAAWVPPASWIRHFKRRRPPLPANSDAISCVE